MMKWSDCNDRGNCRENLNDRLFIPHYDIQEWLKAKIHQKGDGNQKKHICYRKLVEKATILIGRNAASMSICSSISLLMNYSE